MKHGSWIGIALLVACSKPQSAVHDAGAPSPPPPPIVSVAPIASAEPRDATADFESVVGEWYVAEENGVKGLKVDGSKWRSGEPSVSLADQAKRLYGDRYAEFLDGVKSFAFFPFTVAKAEPPRGDIRISVRFFPEGGKIDQAAGIIFAVAPNGQYWGVRANALEDNILFFKVVNGKRTVLDTVRNVPTPSKTWHTLDVELRGKHITATLDGTKRFEKTLDFVPEGRVGLWSKADSQVLFADFSVVSIKN
jgi:hypothetical protein